MTDIERFARQELDHVVPLPASAVHDWDDVRRRARGHVNRRRARVALVTALVAATFVAVAGAVGGTHALGDFSAWLRGAPGRPADQAERNAFDRAARRSWHQFPVGTELRRLIEREVGGTTYVLFGFRSGGSLCLRLVVDVPNEPPAVSCAPEAELQAARAPVVVVLADHGVGLNNTVPSGRRYVAARASATFGIVADGVEAVQLQLDRARRDAIVESNAFLFVEDLPAVGERVRHVVAIGPDARRSDVPFAVSPFGESDTQPDAGAKAAGPSGVERRVAAGRVGWLERREARGEAPPTDAPYGRPADVDFVRLLTPDLDKRTHVLVGIGNSARAGAPAICVFLVIEGTASGRCVARDLLFESDPVLLFRSRLAGGDQFETIGGLASDDVKRLEMYLATGERRALRLSDNAFVGQAPRARYPLRVVAYDAAGRIVENETLRR